MVPDPFFLDPFFLDNETLLCYTDFNETMLRCWKESIMLISKKDLLAITGISYGQLYRWKRERLIPEEWFIKQSSYTGQETFFPREQILSRIQSIQELKDKYSLEELAKMLSPEVAPLKISLQDLTLIQEVNQGLIPIFINSFEKEEFDYVELLMMVILSQLNNEGLLPFEAVAELIAGLRDQLRNLKSTGVIYLLLELNGIFLGVIYQDQAQLILDERFTVLKEIRMDEVSNQIKMKYKQIGRF